MFIFNMTLPARIDLIFNPILKQIFTPKNFSSDTNKIVDTLATATIKLWNKVKGTLLPTPAKFHYVFNLRDVSRIFKGMCQVTASTINNSATFGAEIKPEVFLISCWRHECERVFVDKLISQRDKDTVENFLNEVSVDAFQQYENEILEKLSSRKIYFCDFLQPDVVDEDGQIIDEAPKVYEGIWDIPALKKRCEDLLVIFNDKFPAKRMDLVLFDDALSHLIRVSRIIQMKRSSALLVGVGGSGKQSLTKLAANIGRQSMQQIVLTKTYNEGNLKDDIRNLFDIAGHKGIPVSFIMTDAEVKQEGFLEFINMVLSTGEIPGLIAKDEREIWLGDCRTEYVKKYKDNKEPSALEIYEWFVNRLRDNLHIVLCFSPVGNKFRDRARKFPAVFSECSIDWFLPWPAEALMNVADQSLSNFPELDTKPETRQELPRWMAAVHNQVNDMCDVYMAKMRRAVFVTPKSYLSFLKAYKNLYKIKYSELDESEQKFKVGLDKIRDAKEDIEKLEKA